MCGIAGILTSVAGRPPERAELAAMIERLQHRGPDGTGMLIDGAIGLAHARLSIIDLATGQQPIHNEDRTVWVVFNGEIFNYTELRRDLSGRVIVSILIPTPKSSFTCTKSTANALSNT